MKSVLLVDDEQAILLAAELVLSGEFRVLKALTGEEALICVKDCTPDVILMDIMMPGLGGLETLRILKSHPNYKSIPVILMSGARPLARQAEFGWSELIFKPFTGDQLLQTIKKYI